MKPPVILVNMPWAMLRAPSLQLSTIKALLARHGIIASVLNLNLAWMKTLHEAGFSVADYIKVEAAAMAPGDWTFAIPPFRPASAAGVDDVAGYRDSIRGAYDDALFAALLRMRELVPGFVDACVERIVARAPRVVGFTSTFQQNVSSLLLAQALKQRLPDVITVFGGANCDGPMGAALHRSFDFIDVVVRGEAEPVAGQLFSELLMGKPISPQPGLCFRQGTERIEVPQGGRLATMDEVPTPDHSEYFAEIDRMPFAGEIPQRWIPFESARGCWWGQKHHCTFCGLNGSSMRFRSKAPDRVVSELVDNASRYGVTHFNSSDNIIELGYFESVLPQLSAAGYDFHIFYETKSNIKKPQIAAMAAAGVVEVQPGIESLSTKTLKLMKKGTTALQNVRMLKWSLEHHILIEWNLLYGFPGEDPEEYRKMAELVPSLVHLEPPSMFPIDVQRFSPYHDRPEDHQITVRGARSYYRFLYPLAQQDLDDIAYSFEFEARDSPPPQSYIGPLAERVEAWRRESPLRLNSLQFRRGPGFLEIDDGRGDVTRRHRLGGSAAAAYLALDAGATPRMVHSTLQAQGTPLAAPELDRLLEQLLEQRLVMEDGGRYLSLALPVRPPR